MNRVITLADLARDLHLAKSTVSRALRGCPSVNDGTRDRVAARARALGYQPNPAFAALAAQHFAPRREPPKPAIAWLEPPGELPPDEVANARERVAAAAARAESLGFVLRRWSWPGDSAADFATTLRAATVTGVICDGFEPAADGALARSLHAYPVVCCSGQPVQGRYHAVRTMDYSVISTAWQLAVERGYRRIGVCPFSLGARGETPLHRVGLVAFEQARCRPALDPLPVFCGSTAEAFERWRRAHDPDAIIAADDTLAAALETAGVRVPGDVGLLLLRRCAARPDLTQIVAPEPALGRAAVDLCVQLLRVGETGAPECPRTLQLDARRVDSGSLPARPEPPPAHCLAKAFVRPPRELTVVLVPEPAPPADIRR